MWLKQSVDVRGSLGWHLEDEVGEGIAEVAAEDEPRTSIFTAAAICKVVSR